MSECPKCGAEFSGQFMGQIRFACNSEILFAGGPLMQSDRCRLAVVKRERDEARKTLREVTLHQEKMVDFWKTEFSRVAGENDEAREDCKTLTRSIEKRRDRIAELEAEVARLREELDDWKNGKLTLSHGDAR